MDNKRTEGKMGILITGVIVTGGVLINALTLFYYTIYDGIFTSIVILVSLLSFESLWRKSKYSDGKGIGCSLTFYLLIHLGFLLFGLFFKELVTAPFHWGFG